MAIPLFLSFPPQGHVNLIYFLSLCICLFWAFHTNGIMALYDSSFTGHGLEHVGVVRISAVLPIIAE